MRMTVAVLSILAGLVTLSDSFVLSPTPLSYSEYILSNGGSHAVTATRNRKYSCTSSRRNMISDFFNQKQQQSNTNNNKNAEMEAALPRDVKDAVKRCREATQAALQSRTSRMRVEFPVGTQFGVEPRSKTKSKELTLNDLRMSDRELARVYVEMFQPVGGEHIIVVFRTEEEADAAKNVWQGDPTAKSIIRSIDRNKKEAKKKAKNRGFAAKLAAEIEGNDDSGPFQLPDKAEVVLFVSPSLKEKPIIDRVCDAAGMGTLVILLNARDESLRSKQDFQDVFCLGAAPQEAAPSCLLYHCFENPWVLARKPKIGPPRSILRQELKPSVDECKAAFDALELSPVERNVENVLENAVSWFR